MGQSLRSSQLASNREAEEEEGRQRPRSSRDGEDSELSFDNIHWLRFWTGSSYWDHILHGGGRQQLLGVHHTQHSVIDGSSRRTDGENNKREEGRQPSYAVEDS